MITIIQDEPIDCPYCGEEVKKGEKLHKIDTRNNEIVCNKCVDAYWNEVREAEGDGVMDR